ncbi:MAG: MFS transporter, partial [Acidimicrobiales bacterium]
LGVVIAVQGLGAIAGGISSPRLIRRFGEGPVIGLGLAFLAGGAVLFLVANVWVVFAAAIVLGASLPWIIVAYNTQLQLRTPTNLQGRAFSASDTLTSVPQTVSIAVGAALLSIVDYRLLLVAVGAIVAIAACYQLSRREQWKRDIGEGPDQLSLLAFSAEAPIEPPVGEAVR